MVDRPEEVTLPQEFGVRVRRRRLELDLMQMQVAEVAGISLGMMSRIERGRFQTLSLRTIAGLARALYTSLDYLFGATDDAGPRPFDDVVAVSVA